jgi:hypothetical protein
VSAPLALPASAVQLINSGVHAHLATISADGRPQLSMVWSTVEDGEICVASLTPRQKLRNVKRDARVSIAYESSEHDDQQGLRYYLVVEGLARVRAGGAPELLRRIAPRYLAPGVKFPRGDNPPPGWLIRVAPVRWRGYGPWGEGP